MSVPITIPDEVALVLGAGPVEREQRARETIALERYREGKITLRSMGRLAGVGDDYWAADAFRARHGLPVIPPGSEAEADDAKAIEQLLRP
jgi:hypothetical protein